MDKELGGKRFGKLVRLYRKMQGMTQKQFAGHIRISPSSLGQVENGRWPSERELVALTDELDIPTLVVFYLAQTPKDIYMLPNEIKKWFSDKISQTVVAPYETIWNTENQ